MFTYLFFEVLVWLMGLLALAFLIANLMRQKALRDAFKKRGVYMPLAGIVLAFLIGFLVNKTYPPAFAMPAFMRSHAPGGLSASLPFRNVLNFLLHVREFEEVSDISADPRVVPTEPQQRDADGVVRIYLKAQEVISEIAPGIYQNYWTFNKQVPGPMLRVREGDTVEVTLENERTSLHAHSIDLHAVNGPGGGAVVTAVSPGERKTFRFKALNPGLYIYHCAMPNVSTHNSHGQYGLILVESQDSSSVLSAVEREFYVVQGEFYTKGELGKRGLMQFDARAMLDGRPNYVVFNGKVESAPRLEAKVGERVRIYVGNGGVNLVSSFHVIGEVFDKVYPEAAIGEESAILQNVQTTAVLPGGAAIVEFKLDVPGRYLLVDHALARMNKGAWAVLEVSGDENPDIFSGVP